MDSLIFNSFQEKTKLLFFLDSLKVDKATKEKISLVYQYAEILHHGQIREDGTNYFDHPTEVANIIKNEFHEQWIELNKRAIILALLHDVLEDTDIEFEILANIFSLETAKDVHEISKKPWINYLQWIWKVKQQTSKFTKFLLEILKTPEFPIIINNNHHWILIKKYEELISQSWKGKIIFYIIWESTETNKDIEEKLAKLAEKYWKIFEFKYKIYKATLDKIEKSKYSREDIKQAVILRNNSYFLHMCELDDIVLMVKFADRLHNLFTMDNFRRNKKERKIKETETYFLRENILKKIKDTKNPEIKKISLSLYEKIEKQITELKKQLDQDISSNIWEITPQLVKQILQ